MAVAELPPRVLTNVQDVCPDYELKGDSSRSLLEQFGAVIRQWQDRPSMHVSPAEELETVSHVPFPKAGTMKVRFRISGPMAPRIVDIDEATEE